MPFQKGHKLSKGRPKNSKNKVSQELKGILTDFLHENIDDLQDCVRGMKREDRFNAYMQIVKYVIPAMKAVDMKVGTDDSFQPVTIVFDNEKKLT